MYAGCPAVTLCWGAIMRKIALLLAAALFVSVPLISATPSISYAAAKKKAPAATAKPQAKRGGREEITDLYEVNTRFARAINDLAIKLSQPWPTSATTTGRGGGQTGFTAGRGTNRTAGAPSRRGGAGPRGTQSQ
jgi:hypothetical protein